MKQSTFDLNGRDQTPGIACGEMPQQRFETYGAPALSDTELIALLLHSGIQGHSVLRLASQLIAQAGSIAGLINWQPVDFQRLKGIGQAKARQLAALVEVGRRMMKQPTEAAPTLDRPELIAEYLTPITRGLAVEKFWVLSLNRKNRLIKLTEVTSGTATSSLAHPREVFRVAIQHGATAIVPTIILVGILRRARPTSKSPASSGTQLRPSILNSSTMWSWAKKSTTRRAAVTTASVPQGSFEKTALCDF
jgi:DNA repair protein RadC